MVPVVSSLLFNLSELIGQGGSEIQVEGLAVHTCVTRCLGAAIVC